MAEATNVGETYRARVEFRVNGALTDPETVTAKAFAPSGAELAQSVVREAQGVYVAYVTVTEPGVWYYSFTGTAPAQGVESGSFRAVPLPSREARYSSPDDVREALAEDVTDEATAASFPDSTILSAIARADAEIDSELSGAYSVPFPTAAVPFLVNRMSIDLAVMEAALRHLRHVPMVKDHPVRLRGEAARALLRRVAEGKADLTDAEGEVATDGAGVGAVVNPRESPLWDLAGHGLHDPLTGWPPYR